MKDPLGSITQVRRLVESLCALAGEEPGGFAATVPDSSLWEREVAGRRFMRGLMEIWADMPEPDQALCVSAAHLAAVQTGLSKTAQSLRGRIESLGRRRDFLIRKRNLEQERLSLAEAAAGQRVFNAGGRVKSLELTREQTEKGLIKLEGEAEKLAAWLDGINVKGMNRFQDAQGRVIKQSMVREAAGRLSRTQAELASARESLASQSGFLAQARAEEKERARAYRDVLARVREMRPLLKKCAHAQGLAENLIAGNRARLEQTEAELRQGQALGHYYARILRLASAELGPWLAGPWPEPDDAPATGVEDSLSRAAGAASRQERLAAVQVKYAKRLALKEPRIAQALKEQRRINRELSSMEDELARLIEPMAGDKALDEKARAKAAAGLSTLSERVKALSPQALGANLELEGLRAGLKVDQDRAQSCQEAWRGEGKKERAQLDQARALVEEARQAGIGCQRDLEDKIAGLSGLFKAFTGLLPLDLIPSLAAGVQLVAGSRVAARAMEERAAGLEAGIGPPGTKSLAKTPAALKPYSTAIRRLSGKTVDLNRAEALAASASRWLKAAEAPFVESLRAPVKKVALNLSASLGKLAKERADLARELGLIRDRSREMGRELDGVSKERDQALKINSRLTEENRTTTKRLGKLERELDLSRDLARRQREKKRAARADADALENRLNQALSATDGLTKKLAHTEKAARALRDKSLERHRRYRQAAYAEEWLDYWRGRALEHEARLGEVRAELDQARREYQAGQAELKEAARARDAARAQLGRERSARARQAMDFLGGQALSVELAATKSEAKRWSAMADSLAAALIASGAAHQQETQELREQVEMLSLQAAELKKQLSKVAPQIQGAGPNRWPKRGAPLSGGLPPEQVDRALGRLASARRRLSEMGRNTLGNWAVIAALTSGLVLIPPGTPSKATRSESPLLPPRPIVHRLVQELDHGAMFDIPVKAAGLKNEMGRGGASINLLPLRSRDVPLSDTVKQELRGLAAKSGLSPRVLVASARALFTGRSAVETRELTALALKAKELSKRHPVIFKEISAKGFTPNAAQVVALKPDPDAAQNLFMDRLYQEYRHLGFSPEESLGALVANEKAVDNLNRAWMPPDRFKGKVKPLTELEEMRLKEFIARMPVYMKHKLNIFLKQRRMTFAGDIDRYARRLAFDMYCAAKKFKVPLTFMMAIAHQETWYANVLGDVGRSASPFQIYEPTRALIRTSMKNTGFAPPPAGVKLERHLTMATYMAAFHLRELMLDAYLPAKKGRKALVDSDKVLLRYNGSVRYISQVNLRKRQIAKFLKNPRKLKGS